MSWIWNKYANQRRIQSLVLGVNLLLNKFAEGRPDFGQLLQALIKNPLAQLLFYLCGLLLVGHHLLLGHGLSHEVDQLLIGDFSAFLDFI